MIRFWLRMATQEICSLGHAAKYCHVLVSIGGQGLARRSHPSFSLQPSTELTKVHFILRHEQNPVESNLGVSNLSCDGTDCLRPQTCPQSLANSLIQQSVCGSLA